LELSNLRLAVLIDAENVPRNCMKRVLEEIAIYGTPTIKRIYGDWTSSVVAGWKGALLENAVTPIQQYSYTTGKNSSDSAMIIDAMDILYTDKTDGFVIVSSDSDFTRLAIRLREAGQRVIGIGERKTPKAFIAACDKFTYVEVIMNQGAKSRKKKAGQDEQAGDATAKKNEDNAEQNSNEKDVNGQNKTSDRADQNEGQESQADDSNNNKQGKQNSRNEKVPDDIIEIIADSVADLMNDSGAVFMGELGNLILKKKPDFDCRNFGHKTLSSLIKSIDRFETDFRHTADPNIKHVFVRDKEAL